MKYEKLAKDILKHVGGRENINSVVHCITRLRFQLKDEGKANTEVLKSMEDVVTVMKSGGQYQVVIGNHVSDVYKALIAAGGFQETEEESASEKKKSSLIDILSSIFTPILGVLAATGMIKGFNALFVALGWLSTQSGTYQILNAVGDSLFYFFPIFLGYTASKKFGGSPFIGMAIGGALVYPALSGLKASEPLYTLFAGTMFESPIHITFLGIPVILMNYASSVIPIILATYFGAKVEKSLKKVIPDVVKTFVLPFLTLLIVVPVTFLVIGPIATWAGQFLGQATLWVYHLSPLVAGIVLGAFWQVLVIFGLHWGIVPIGYNNLAVHGIDPILALIFATSFAQIGAVLGVWMKTKDRKLKTLSIPAFISGIFGVTEPAIYGVTLPLKKPFIMSCIAGGIGGGILGVFGTQAYMTGGLGIFALPTFISPKEGITAGFWGAIIAMVVSLIVGFVLTYLFGFTKKKDSTESAEAILSPFHGAVMPLQNIDDAAFASGALGEGVAIDPSEGKLFSPVSGTISALFPTNHAVGITADSGAEILIHIGMDTVKLNGEFFSSYIEQGARVEKGQLLIEFNIAEIQKAGYVVTTPVVVTNYNKYSIKKTEVEKIQAGDSLLELGVK
ncbi:beta-glucoside-specific PTS transporter subunit IIABC [Bacillus toyonensis]|uniref:PTS beta-glucoside transporter subunit IIABC n=1 Tax=Bacillus toyonensis TaxID=155322 RepID=A0AB36T569_9BACI|nr:beta-glucoside-specific PTS transporter subunit IIABC [Bacillus toyonensis]PEC08770.1 PTS beta-glucoside transporter subunit IIABC [Bacillus toyonensis]PEN88895.1 PTS beta-glucoside transporter subunit IIABC [Bacillus toyonensis]